jgi:hypothetical protein
MTILNRKRILLLLHPLCVMRCFPYGPDILGSSSHLLALWFIARLIFDPEDGSDAFFLNVCSYTDYYPPVTDYGGLWGCEMLMIQHCLDNRLTVNCEILSTCSSTYSPVCISQKEYSVSIK